MRTVRRFVSPGWILGLLAVIAFTWACFTLLAPWQLGKSDDLDARNDRLNESVLADPAPLPEVVSGPGDFVEREWRLVTSTGRWQPDAEALLRLRPVDGEHVFHVLTVFEPTDGEPMLVNRGTVPVGENNTVPDYAGAPTGTVDITSRVRAPEAGQIEPAEVDGMPAVRAIDPTFLGDALDYPVGTAGFLQLTADQPGSLTPAPIPAIETGPYLSYGLQWLAFGVLAPVALLYFAWSEIRARRREADDTSTAGVTAAAGGPGGDDDTAAGGPDWDDDVDAPPRGDDQTGSSAHAPASVDDDLEVRRRALLDRYGQRDEAEHRRAFRRADRLRS